ncbi:hypothetical protein BGW36DRAFT_24684 [Talaromyces proteolyticus]|uniref:Uncharacterized protein n=1 Tax=Talaromyces proteolyticus TaxID=1131652 RepID=A0AAD4KPI5_9EURO|nr:uncharacterized protein BGW36DRAFT_24684 [Talaromyces proteolyticus]KAH8692679.1 hypothetical protein BGW36DRAFT_24684 [Talaromyces proteolyticus]
MNFIRLWAPENLRGLSDDEETQAICSNILDVAFVRAFRSLLAKILSEFFETPAAPPYSGLGLNNLTPLYQGIDMNNVSRREFIRAVEISHDPQIKDWPAFRFATWKQREDEGITKWDKYLTIQNGSTTGLSEAAV